MVGKDIMLECVWIGDRIMPDCGDLPLLRMEINDEL